MRAAVIMKQGTPVAGNVKVVEDWRDPVAAPGELVVRTEASALNHLDLWVGQGLPGLDLEYPFVSGSDGAGIVESVGAGVDSGWIGRRVILNAAMLQPEPLRPDMPPSWPDTRMIGEHEHGTHAQRFVAPASNVLDIGRTDPVEAAAFGLTHLTAWRMLRSRAGLQPGRIVLITGIGGGVALAALNIARHFACTTIVTSRKQAKLDKARAMGATHTVLDSGQDWSNEVRTITGRRGVDICIDSSGKAIFFQCIKSLARGGAYVTCGCTSGHEGPTDLARVFWNQLSILGSTMGDMDEFRQIVGLLVSGAIKPVVDMTVDSREAAKAYARLESAEQFGKVVIRWS